MGIVIGRRLAIGLPGAIAGGLIYNLSLLVDGGEIQLLWANRITFDEIQILRSETSGSGYSVIDTLAGDAVSYSDDTWAYDTTYYYKIRGIKGSSEYNSSQVSVTASGIGFMELESNFQVA